MAVIWNTSCKKYIIWARDIKSMFFFNCYYICFQDMQSFFEFLVLVISTDAKYIFLSCPRHCNRGLIVIIVYYFQIRKKNKNIIISRFIRSHMGPTYIETAYINGLHLFWMILSPNKYQCKIYFPLVSKALWSRINSYYSILFSNLKQKKKKKHIIISRVISSHMGSMYIETPCIIYIGSFKKVLSLTQKEDQ